MIPRHLKILIGVLAVIAIGLGIYTFQLKRRAERVQNRTTDLRPLAPPVEGPTERVNVWMATDEDGELHLREVKSVLPEEPTARTRQVLHALFSAYLEKPSPHPIGEGTDVKDVYLLPNGTLVLDFTAPLADEHRSGILVEDLTLMSILQTVASNVPNVSNVKILIDGKERDTLAGHVNLRQTFDLPVAAEAAKGLQ